MNALGHGANLCQYLQMFRWMAVRCMGMGFENHVAQSLARGKVIFIQRCGHAGLSDEFILKNQRTRRKERRLFIFRNAESLFDYDKQMLPAGFIREGSRLSNSILGDMDKTHGNPSVHVYRTAPDTLGGRGMAGDIIATDFNTPIALE